MKIRDREFRKLDFDKELTTRRYNFALSAVQEARKYDNIEVGLLRTGGKEKILACTLIEIKDGKEVNEFNEKKFNELSEFFLDSNPEQTDKPSAEVLEDFLNFMGSSQKDSQKSTKKKGRKKRTQGKS